MPEHEVIARAERRHGLAGAGAVGPGTRWTPSILDLGLVLGGAAGVATEALIRNVPGVSPAAYLLVLVASVPLALRTFRPVTTLLVVAAGAILCAAVLHASWVVSAIVGVALFTVALRGDRRRSLAFGIATSVLVIAAVLAIDGGIDAGALVTRLTLVVVCVGAGELLRTRQELIVARRERAAQEARERAEALLRAAAAERLEIARELHDSLGHFLVAINVRASVAVEVPETQDPAAALADIKQVSADALRDLRSTLSVLRDERDRAPTGPAPGLDSLDALVAGASAAGVDTTLELTVPATSVPAAASAATVRIVQESLTNVLKHARASHASVRVRADDRRLAIEVRDDGCGRPAPELSPGYGVRGMTERAVALGGHLEAGPLTSGGWCVRADLPLAPEAP